MERIGSMMTVDEFEQVAESLGPCELIKGEVVFMSPGGFFHSQTSSNIGGLLRDCCEKEKCGRVLTNEAGVVTDPGLGTVRGADALYISYKRLAKGKGYEGFLRTPPELVAEVEGKDDTWKKLKQKVDEYHNLGVDLVWVADPKTRSVRIYPRGGKPLLKHDGEFIDGGKVLPKFKCRISRFFED